MVSRAVAEGYQGSVLKQNFNCPIDKRRCWEFCALCVCDRDYCDVDFGISKCIVLERTLVVMINQNLSEYGMVFVKEFQ